MLGRRVSRKPVRGRRAGMRNRRASGAVFPAPAARGELTGLRRLRVFGRVMRAVPGVPRKVYGRS